MKKNKIETGDITGSAVAIGERNKAILAASLPEESVQAIIAGLDQIIVLLDGPHPDLPHEENLKESAAKARKRMGQTSPNLKAVGRLLTRIAAGAGGFNALADAVAKVQALVHALL